MGAHIAAVLGVWLTNIQFWWQTLAWLLIAAHGIYAWRTIGWMRRLQQLDYSGGEFRLLFTDGEHVSVVGGGEFVTPWLTILRVQLNGRWRSLPLFRDCASAEDLRRLRVLLRCRGSLIKG